jgi:tetratricopeptide (TPR) repeat protein
VNKPEHLRDEEDRLGRPVFVSYATADRKQALQVTRAIERRGRKCWISSRDVAPGENYQEAIVRSIRTAKAMVLVFSNAANDSDEIKKELSLASKYKLPVLALRIEDVEPSDAFAYELSTRQWIDAFEGWDKSMDALVSRIQDISGAETIDPAPAARAHPRSGSLPARTWVAATLGLFLVAIAAGGWWLLRPRHAAVHTMMVRLASFQPLSKQLPTTMPDEVGAEITAAFNADGVIGVSAATAPLPGPSPAYAIGGTINRIGNSIRVITNLTNERSGAILWSDSKDYSADQAAKIARWVAVDVGIVVRCGLFGASTYHKPLPDPVLKDYMQYCQQSWSYGGNKTLIPAQRVVAAVPDFSWGWSAVTMGFMQSAFATEDSRLSEEARAGGRQAADRAIALDPTNSEALAHKALVIDPKDWPARESLLKRSIDAQPLDCGCQHYNYALMLQSVGRVGEAVEQFRQATDMLALWPDSQFGLAEALIDKGRLEEARSHSDAATDLSSYADYGQWLAVKEGIETRDFAPALKALRDPKFTIGGQAALAYGYEALASGNSGAKTSAVRMLLALPQDQQSTTVASMLAALGATREALQVASKLAAMPPYGPKLFWRRSMRGVLNEAGFPAVAAQLGLMRYWKTTHTKPDVCSDKDAPTFCKMV